MPDRTFKVGETVRDLFALFLGMLAFLGLGALLFWLSTLLPDLRYLGYALFVLPGLWGVVMLVWTAAIIVLSLTGRVHVMQRNRDDHPLQLFVRSALGSALFLGCSGTGTYVFWSHTFQSQADPNSATIAEFKAIKNEIEKQCNVSFLRFDEGRADKEPGICVMVTNNSTHVVMELELGYSLYANGNCIYKTGYFNIFGLPVWTCQIPAGKSKNLIDTIERNSDDYFKLKTAGTLELRVTSIDVRIARVNGKTIDFTKWEVVDVEDNERLLVGVWKCVKSETLPPETKAIVEFKKSGQLTMSLETKGVTISVNGRYNATDNNIKIDWDTKVGNQTHFDCTITKLSSSTLILRSQLNNKVEEYVRLSDR